MRTIDLEARNRSVRPADPAVLPTSPGVPGVIVTCLDARVDPAHIAGIEPGEAAVFRNVGGRVTDELVEQIGVIAGLAKVAAGDGVELDVAVIHHTQCGASRLSDPALRDRLAEHAGTTPDRIGRLAIHDPAESLREDIERLRRSSLPAGLTVTGYLYDVASGELAGQIGTAPLRAAPGASS